MAYQFNFVLKKLVLVDSAGFCYSEIELDKHTILLGEGNVGKSSLLNCIRLFLLPEVNFNKAKDKFNFRSSNGDEYDKDQSFGHYFPTKYSHLIIEVEKIIGGKKHTHCQILSRGNNLAFERIFTTLSYNEIRSLFWQVEEGDLHQIGSRVDKLSTQEVFANIKSKDKYCITVKDPQKLKDLMYARDILSEVAMRYSLFPLNDASEENVESLRALILMLFDMKTSSKAVAKAVANLIESEKKETTDALSFDIQSFMSTHDQLKFEEQKLTDIENKTTEYNQLTYDFSSYSKLSSSESDFVNFYLYLNDTLNNTNQKASQSATVISNFQKELKPLNGEIAEQGQIIFSANRNIKKLTKDIDTVNKDITKAKAEINLYGDTDITEIIEILDDDIKDTSEKIKALNDADARRNRIIKLQNQINSHQQNLQQLELEISNSEFAIKQQLPSDSLALLNSLSQKLTLANPGRQLSEHEFNAIINFQSLFEDKGYSYSFFGSVIPKSNAFSTRNLQKEIENIQSEVTAKSSERKSLENQATENPLVIENKLKDLTRQLTDANRVKLLIFNYQENKHDIKIYSKQKIDEQGVVNNIQPLISKLSDRQAELTELIEAEKLKQASIEKEQTELQTINNLAQGTTHAYPKIKRQLEKQKQYIGKAIEITAEHLRKLQNNLLEVEQLRIKIIDTLKRFATDKFVEVDQDLFSPSPLPSVIHSTFMEVKRIYDELVDQRLLLRNKTKMHNESVSNYVDILGKNFEHINRFESQLNRSFKGISINDLNEIEVSIHIDSRFSNLIKEIHKSYNQFTEQTLSEQFYIRLQAFSDA
ncbi:MAG: hypothetical protein ACI9YH_005180, partial [Colwellia sp.]